LAGAQTGAVVTGPAGAVEEVAPLVIAVDVDEALPVVRPEEHAPVRATSNSATTAERGTMPSPYESRG